MEAIYPSETSVQFQLITLRYIPVITLKPPTELQACGVQNHLCANNPHIYSPKFLTIARVTNSPEDNHQNDFHRGIVYIRRRGVYPSWTRRFQISLAVWTNFFKITALNAGTRLPFYPVRHL
jgi:hypothetical protein